MLLTGKLVAESPIFRGNAKKTLFTRDGDGKERLVSLAGEISGTAESLMDAFIGSSRNGKNSGLLNQLWLRLYGDNMPANLVSRVDCRLHKECYPRDGFFDLRMGIKLDEDRWAAEANANYKVETLFRNAIFNLKIEVNDSTLQAGDNHAKLYYLLQELVSGRFWFGAGKSKGLGRCRIEFDSGLDAPAQKPKLHSAANHLELEIKIQAANPILVGWNWGKIDPNIPAFAAIEGRLLIGAMRDLPESIRTRLEMGIGGPIISPADWKQKFARNLPKVAAIWIREQSTREAEGWVFPAPAVEKLGKGKHALSKKLIDRLASVVNRPFSSREEAEATLKERLGKKANMAGRIMEVLVRTTESVREFAQESWTELAEALQIDPAQGEKIAAVLTDENAVENQLRPLIDRALPGLFEQVDQQVKLLQSDAWIDVEIANREEHLKIKSMLMRGEISEEQWQNASEPPEGVKAASWNEFLAAHSRVRYRHMLNQRNLQKSITNDRNHIEFLKAYRSRTRQELSQIDHLDFRAGGKNNREISRQYGKPYDTLFMRMLVWSPSATNRSQWEVFIPGSTVKGAFRKRASQVLRTLWGESERTNAVLDTLFGKQGKRGLVFFSDAYLENKDENGAAWCSMDGVKMNPHTGEPIEEAKSDYLYAYGESLSFRLKLDLQDLSDRETDAITVLKHLLQDFQAGEIPLGGEKTNGCGWVEAQIENATWRTGGASKIHKTLFGDMKVAADDVWQTVSLQKGDMQKLLQAEPLKPSNKIEVEAKPHKSSQGFVSHRKFGAYCGTLVVTGEVLTPTHVKESGEPSETKMGADGVINGWDFFALAHPEAKKRGSDKEYALPSKSIRGMLRHVYAIAADVKEDSKDLGALNPVDSLFGWVGEGPNQAIAGRISIDFAKFTNSELSWFKIPYPYGNWQFQDGQWKQIPKKRAAIARIADTWRIFPHVPLAPIAEKMNAFDPDTSQSSYGRCILPGGRFRFSIRYWNLEKEELQRLIWCLALEEGMAHKIGGHRYLGFGSVRLSLSEESFITDWENRYGDGDDKTWKMPIRPQEWINKDVIRHYDDLKTGLNADAI